MSRTLTLTTVCAMLLLRAADLAGQGRTATLVAAPDTRTGIIAVEVESLMGSASVTHGQIHQQDMRPFGSGWSQNGQLFWAVAQLGAQLRLTFKTEVQGRYEVYLRFTRAPDYALARASFDGTPHRSFNGYAPTVSSDRALLAMLDLTPGVRELLVEVAMKDGKSTGLNVGLDRLELRPVGRHDAVAQNASIAAAQAAAQMAQKQSGGSTLGEPTVAGNAGPIIASPQLAFAVYGPNGKNPTLGGTDQNVYGAQRTVSLAWKGGSNVPFRWQVMSQPYSRGTGVSLTPTGLLGEGPAAPGSFKIDLGSLHPAALAGPNVKDVARDYYIRIIPVLNGAVAGPPSNMVVAHYVPGPNPSVQIGAVAYANTAAQAKKLAEMKEQAKIYQMAIVKWQPMVFEDPRRWGCVFVISNPHENNPTSPLFGYKANQEACGKHWKSQGQSYQATNVWDVLGGWIKAYDVLASFFSSTKSWIATQIAKLAPCEEMGSQLATTCEDFVKDVTSAGMSAGLVAAGLPPTLPNVSELEGVAEGKVAQAAADFTCMQFETQGGHCTPAMRDGLAKLFAEGIDQLQAGITRAAKEPGCEDVQGAHDHNREPLPCFTKYGAEVKSAPGAVTAPAWLTVRVRRVKANPPFPLPACNVTAGLNLTTNFEGGNLYGVDYKPATLQGTPFLQPSATIPALGLGEATDITLVFDPHKPFHMKGYDGTGFWMEHWLELYVGGKGPLFAFPRTVTPVAGAKGYAGQNEKLDCGDGATMAVQIPK